MIILGLFLCLSVQAQIELTVAQDGKLAVMDDGHGNKPYTADILTLMRWYPDFGEKKFEWANDTFVNFGFEYADLNDGRYIYYGMGAGYTFKQFADYTWSWDFLNFLRNMELTVAADYGVTDRWDSNAFSWRLYTDVGYKVTDRITITIIITLTERPDLLEKWGTKELTYAVYYGLKWDVFVPDNTKR